jgi:hypothetical protein
MMLASQDLVAYLNDQLITLLIEPPAGSVRDRGGFFSESHRQ